MRLGNGAWALLLALVFGAGPARAGELAVNGDFSAVVTPNAGIPGWMTGTSGTPGGPVPTTASAQGTPPPCVFLGSTQFFSQSGTGAWIAQTIQIPLAAAEGLFRCAYQWGSLTPWNHRYAFGNFVPTQGATISLFVEERPAGAITPEPTPGWTLVQKSIPLHDYAGQTVTLYFEESADSTNPNYLYLDGISLLALTATNSPIVSPTPTFTASPLVSSTPTVTHSPTRSQTGTRSPTYTFSPTPTPLGTKTPPPSRTPSVSPTSFIQRSGQVTAFPNPADGDRVQFQYTLTHPGRVTVEVYNLAGFRVARIEGAQPAAADNAAIAWNLRGVAPGVYLYRMLFETTDGGKSETPIKKLIVAPGEGQ